MLYCWDPYRHVLFREGKAHLGVPCVNVSRVTDTEAFWMCCVGKRRMHMYTAHLPSGWLFARVICFRDAQVWQHLFCKLHVLLWKLAATNFAVGFHIKRYAKNLRRHCYWRCSSEWRSSFQFGFSEFHSTLTEVIVWWKSAWILNLIYA